MSPHCMSKRALPPLFNPGRRVTATVFFFGRSGIHKNILLIICIFANNIWSSVYLLIFSSVLDLGEDYSDSDKYLVLSAAHGSQVAFVALFHRYKNKLYGYTLRLTSSEVLAEDIVQDVFMKLWADHSSLAAIDNFGGYLFRMSRNHVLNHFKRVAHETAIVSEMFRNGEQGNNNAQDMLAAKEVEQVLQSVVETLPPQQRVVYRLSREEGKSHEEIAELLKISPNTVKNHIVQAMATIRTQLRRHSDSLLLAVMLLSFKK